MAKRTTVVEDYAAEDENRTSPRRVVKIESPTSQNTILVALLIVASFLIGVLYTKVQYLEGGKLFAGTQAGTTAAGTQNNTAGAAAGTQAAVPTVAPPGTKYDVANGHFPIKGDESAKVTIVEFADFRCPFCEQFFTQTEPQLFKDYVDTGKVKFSFRQYAFLGPASVIAADAAECANDQNKFWDFHDFLYKNQPPETDTSMYTTDTLTQDAVNLGMDGDKFRSCLDGKTDDSKQAQDMTEGQKVGVSGTPTFFVNGIQLVGAQPYSAFQTLIDQEIAKAK